jgi:16S rRNA (uracil1498-N3)-methyltransferase|tara:strand:- start:8159 stop:8851 length:693 start_codon:yes stop_codon:yes gene_type:complete
MQLFFLEHPDNKIKLNNNEINHINKVLRKKDGDVLDFTDGKGGLYKAQITFIDNRNCDMQIIDHKQIEKNHKYHLHIAIAPTKNIDRFEWFLEKATEIGIDEITPIICKHSERRVIKIDRCKRILRSAIKQSLRYHLPKVNQLTKIEDFIKEDFKGNKYIAHCKKDIKETLKTKDISKRTLILIGPEGGFSKEEIEICLEKRFQEVKLGSNRLRTETAGIVAVSTINIGN